jgi:hypothetical protein
VTKRRHKKDRQTEKTQAVVRSEQQATETGISDEESFEDFESPLTYSYLLAFDEVEQKASERLQEVVRMIDELLKI